VHGLDPGHNFRYWRKVTLNRAGRYLITVTADPRQTVAESQEGSNVRSKMIVVAAAPKPDLVVTRISYKPGMPRQYEHVTVWYYVKNIGQSRAGACYY